MPYSSITKEGLDIQFMMSKFMSPKRCKINVIVYCKRLANKMPNISVESSWFNFNADQMIQWFKDFVTMHFENKFNHQTFEDKAEFACCFFSCKTGA